MDKNKEDIKTKNGNDVWKSLKEYYDDPEILKAKANEFKDGVTDDFDPSEMNGVSRRKFLALLTASAAFAVTACSDYPDKGKVIPYNKRPEGMLPGTADYYSSTCNGCSQGCGILVKTREGRPIKVDGNPDHPINQGKLCPTGQASILNLYDPERLTEPKNNKRKASWEKVDQDIIDALNGAVADGKEISIVTNKINSPTTKKVLSDFKTKYPTTKLYTYDLLSDVNRRNAWKKSYGSSTLPSIKWNNAKVIVSLDADFLSREGNMVENARLYAEGKNVDDLDKFSRLYVVEGGMSLTGMNADYRLKLLPVDQYEFVMSLLNEIIIKKGVSKINLNSAVANKVSNYSLNDFADKNNLDKGKVVNLVNDLIKHQGEAVVYAGNTLQENVHVAANLLNEVLGNTGLYDYDNAVYDVADYSTQNELKALTSSMKNGNIGVVIHLDSNPVYHLPDDYNYVAGLSKVETVITISEAMNETANISSYVLPMNNMLESWGDNHSRRGVYSLQQPVIAPIFNTRQKEAVLLTWINGNPKTYNHDIYHAYLKNNFRDYVFNKMQPLVGFDKFWNASLHDGIVKLREAVENKGNFNQNSFTSTKNVSKKNGFVVHLQSSYFIGDGRFSNNGWLQETPHPVTKVTWDNFAAVSPSTAKKLGVEDNDYLMVKIGSKELKVAAYVQSGMADDLAVIELGYGRTVAGDVGRDVGFNAVKLMSLNSSISPWIYSGASISKTEGRYNFVTTQEHHSLDDEFVKDFHLKRKIIQEGTLEEYKNNPEFIREEKEHLFSITDEKNYPDVKWAMSIDLNKCIGCAACVTSCNVENNIPVVGKEQVGNGREMQWMRIDRYYAGTPDEPIPSNQPMLCQHCDNAPCENVCPVNATNHSPDGLNQMVYNRCVGTRYCLNNCPYKVRRFNFFNFRDHFADAYYDNDLTSLVYNPEVTVRSRGVMEKCTFCVQRIMEARSNAIRDGEKLKGTDVVTACQQACPTSAIVFGDSNDKNSEIAKKRDHKLGYYVLESLNVRPNVTYIAKIRNTHSEEA